MRILFPIHGSGPGVGSEDYMVEVARRLADRGHHITFVVPRGGKTPPGVEADVVVRRPAPATRPALWRLQYVLGVIQHVLSARAVDIDGHDVIVTGVLPSLFGLAMRAGSIPRCYLTLSYLARTEILSYGEPTLDLRMGAFLYHRLQKWAWRRSDVVVSYFPGLTRLRSARYGGSPRALVESPPGVDHNRFKPGARDPSLLAAWGIPSDAPLVVSCCRLVPSKDVAFLIRAFALPATPAAAHLLVVGDGPEQDALERLARECQVSDRVHFAGFRGNVEDYLRAGHLYAFPSRLESFGLTLAQAMATGLPSIARRSRAPEVLTVSESLIVEGESGLLVDSEAEMATAIGDLIAQPERRSAMGTRAAERARAMFDWNRHVDAIDAALCEIAGTRRLGQDRG